MSESENSAIEIQVDKIAQLFHTLDPVPFRERDLDREAEEFIVGWARDLSAKGPLRIVVHLPKSEAEAPIARELEGALRQYFTHREEDSRRDLRELFRMGRYSLVVGILVLISCMAAARLLSARFGDEGFAYFLQEGLLILGWVANWRPLEIFLYEWWPIVRKRRLYRRLAQAETVLKTR